MKVTILTFSPTNQSLIAARYLAQCLDGDVEVHNVTKEKERRIERNFDRRLMIFSCPTFAGRVPELFATYIKEKTTFTRSSAYGILTWGNVAYDDALVELYDLMSVKGVEVLSMAALVVEHGQSAKIGKNAPTSESLSLLAQMARHNPKNGGVLPLRGKRPYREGMRAFDPPFGPVRDHSKCTELGHCYAACPTDALTTEDWSTCIHCHACIRACPNGALSFTNEGYLAFIKRMEESNTVLKKSELFLPQ
ncbi:MAG: 4Fe-4S binding protein [Sphaerochaeta sp.]